MVRVAAQEQFFKKHHVDTDKLSYTHKSDLIKLENTPEKLNIVDHCIREKLSTRELSALIMQERRNLIENKKTNQKESPFANIATIEQLLNKSLKSELITDIDKLRAMHDHTRKDLKNKTAQLLESIVETSRECKKLIKNLERIEKEK